MGLILDMGNVLSLGVDVVHSIASELGLAVAEIEAFSRRDFEALLIGALTVEEFWDRFNRHFGTDVQEDLLITHFHPVPDARVERLVMEVKAAGHRVVCGTNCLEKHYRYHLERGEYAVFDAVYASHLLGTAKPSPSFYLHILEQEGWQAADTFFVDDRAANVAGARQLGIRSFLYKPRESCDALHEWLVGEQVLP